MIDLIVLVCISITEHNVLTFRVLGMALCAQQPHCTRWRLVGEPLAIFDAFDPARRRACIARVRDPRAAAHALRVSGIPRGSARASRVSQLNAAQLRLYKDFKTEVSKPAREA